MKSEIRMKNSEFRGKRCKYTKLEFLGSLQDDDETRQDASPLGISRVILRNGRHGADDHE